ncbi:MAG: hypothetical protein GF334_07500 [Candidatus Altiarchaeales archaeon]|nr:hypothetical protein [Candidatus Altiarchaeales archaeon]
MKQRVITEAIRNLIKVRDDLGYRLGAVYDEVRDPEEIQRRLDVAGVPRRRTIGDDLSTEALLRQAQELVTALPEVPWDNELLADCLYVDPAELEEIIMEASGGRKREVDMARGSSVGRANG